MSTLETKGIDLSSIGGIWIGIWSWPNIETFTLTFSTCILTLPSPFSPHRSVNCTSLAPWGPKEGKRVSRGQNNMFRFFTFDFLQIHLPPPTSATALWKPTGASREPWGERGDLRRLGPPLGTPLPSPPSPSSPPSSSPRPTQAPRCHRGTRCASCSRRNGDGRSRDGTRLVRTAAQRPM